MTRPPTAVLVFNAGSSTLKVSAYRCALDESQPPQLQATATVSRIGGDASIESSNLNGQTARVPVSAPDHATAAKTIIAQLGDAMVLEDAQDAVVAHRVVHGGPRSSHCTIDLSVLRDIEQYSDLAPLHNPPARAVIDVTRTVYGSSTTMFAAFDTALFAGLPDQAKFYAIPSGMSEQYGIRRYGFHGLAHSHMSERASEIVGGDPTKLKMVTLQLGNGCSATAFSNGVAIDTTMGMTPLEGLMMGTRSGDIDPAVVALIGEKGDLSAVETIELLNKRSGLLGVSGLTSDMADLVAAEADGHEGARLARDMFAYRVKKAIGAYAAALGGLDLLVFGGGIGESDNELRERICGDLAHLGIVLDSDRNQHSPAGDTTISDAKCATSVVVVAVDEMAIIAREAVKCVVTS